MGAREQRGWMNPSAQLSPCSYAPVLLCSYWAGFKGGWLKSCSSVSSLRPNAAKASR